MTRDVVTVAPDAPVSQAVELLADAHVSALAVVNLHQELLGVISTTDILGAEAEASDDQARSRVWTDSSVRDLMTPRPLTVSPEQDVREAALEMEYGDVHRLFVEDHGKLVGVISRSDVNRAFAAGDL
jgi:CBS domain-containing protein